MTPEERAVVVQMLRSQVKGDPAATQRLSRMLQYARGDAARLVADGTYPSARFAASTVATQFPFDPREKLVAYLVTVIQPEAEKLRGEMADAADEVTHLAEHMLAPVMRAAMDVAGPLRPDQVGRLIAQVAAAWRHEPVRQEMKHAA